MNKLNKYRYLLWVVGLIGAVALAMLFRTIKMPSLTIPMYVDIAMAILFGIGMLVLVVLGYIVGRKLE